MYGIDKYTKIMLHMDNSTFKDEKQHTITNNNVAISNSIYKFGTGSAYFNGSSYLSTPINNDDFKFYTNDFTIEGLFYATTVTGGCYRLCGIGTNVANSNVFLGYGDVWGGGTKINFGYFNGSGYSDYTSSTLTMPVNTWHHIAVTRKGNTLYLFFNGNLVGTFSFNVSLVPNNTKVYIGCRDSSGGSFLEYVKGYIDEVRISNGIARWTNSFTPPNSPYTFGKVLFKDIEGYKTYNNGWINIGNILDKSMIDIYAMNDISMLSDSNYKQLNNNFKLITFCEDTTYNFKSSVKAIPLKQLIKMTTDYNLSGVDKITSMTLTKNQANNGFLRIVISKDSGATWQSYDGANFNNIDINDKNVLSTNGITSDVFNTLATKWNDYLGNVRKIRLAYLMDVTTNTDIINLDKIEMVCSMQGTWKQAKPIVEDNSGNVLYGDYDYVYTSNNLVKIYLYKTNTYKINYPQ